MLARNIVGRPNFKLVMVSHFLSLYDQFCFSIIGCSRNLIGLALGAVQVLHIEERSRVNCYLLLWVILVSV
jgi:hypothetical protein